MSSLKSSCNHGVRKCCKATFKLPSISTPACSEDLAAVLALPAQWTPKRCGQTLINYLGEGKNKHKKCLDELTRLASVLNKDINGKVRKLSETLLIHIENNQKGMDCILDNTQKKDTPLSVENEDDAQKQITNLFTHRIADILNFKSKALSLERQRAEGLKNILHFHFQKLISIGHHTYKELQLNFDERIFEINQQLLSNSRAYTDLEAHLRVQIDENVLQFRSMINQLCLLPKVRSQHQSVLSWISWYRTSQRSKSSSADKNISNSVCDSLEPNDFLKIDLEELKNCVTSIVEIYSCAIRNVFGQFTDFLNEFRYNIIYMHYFSIKDNVLSEIKYTTDKAVRLIEIGHENLLRHLENKHLFTATQNEVFLMKISLQTLVESLRRTYQIQIDASQLSNAHITRSGIVQKLTVKAVEDIETNFDELELANEIFLNISLEQLRCTPDIDNVHKLYDVIVLFLNEAIKTMDQRKEAEISKFEEYVNIHSLLVNTLLSEYNCFFENNQKSASEIQDSRSSKSTYSFIGSINIDSFCAPIKRVISQTRFQDILLTYWRNEFLESFKNNTNLTSIPEQLNSQARKWVDERKLFVNMRYNIKQISHSIRLERVKTVRAIRLAELHIHKTRLNNHLEAVYDFVNSLSLDASQFLAIDIPELYPLCKWVEDIQNKVNELLASNPLDLEVKRLKMISYAARLSRHQQLFKESLDLVIEKIKNDVEIRAQLVRILNLQFMLTLKLFNEGGKYAAKEAMQDKLTLVKANKFLEARFKIFFDNVNQRQAELLSFANQFVLPIRQLIEEELESGKEQSDSENVCLKKKQEH